MLKQVLLGCAALALLTQVAPASAQQANELATLRQQLQQLQQRIDQLEAAQRGAQPPATVPGAAGGGAAAFNPAIGLVLDGRAGYSKLDRDTYAIAGQPAFGKGAPGIRGFELGEAELNFTANIDDMFYGAVVIAAEEEGGDTEVGLEEAYLQTLALPAGLQVTAGKFKSDIGYLNFQHQDADDFADRPLAYCAFLGCGFADAGLRVSWVAPTNLYVRLGAEAFRGSAYPAEGERHNSTGARSLFARLGGDVGRSLSWQGGLAMLWADARARETGEAPDILTFAGQTRVGIAHLVLKWAGAPAQQLKWQTEVLRNNIDGTFNGDAIDRSDLGWYSQLVYQWSRQWSAGYRYDRVRAGDTPEAFADTALDDMGHTPSRHSAMLQFNHTEFSRLRLQYEWDKSRADERDQTILLQYTMVLGAHPAHQY